MIIKHGLIARVVGLVLATIAVGTPAMAEDSSRSIGAVFNGSYNVGQKFGVTDLHDDTIHQFGMGYDMFVRFTKPAFGSMNLTLGPILSWANGRKSSVAEAYDANENPYLQAQIVGSHALLAGALLGLDMGEKMMGMIFSLEGLVGPKWTTGQILGANPSQAPTVTRFTTISGRLGLAVQMTLLKLSQTKMIAKVGANYSFGSATPIFEGLGNGFPGAWSFHGHAFQLNLGLGFEL